MAGRGARTPISPQNQESDGDGTSDMCQKIGSVERCGLNAGTGIVYFKRRCSAESPSASL